MVVVLCSCCGGGQICFPVSLMAMGGWTLSLSMFASCMSNERWSAVVSPAREAISEAVEEEDVDVFVISSESSSELYDSPETLLLL